MGVKSLWRTLGPYGDKTSVVELQGKQIAVDLSGWICENQSVGEKHKTQQPKLHLRNIFFRTSVLLMANVTPLFILDGDPPDIKQSVLSKRNRARFEHGKTQDVEEENKSSKHKGQRKILKCTLRECEELLNLLGLSCLWSEGEAEAFCALLDHEGVVDGVITQDSDTLLYGAKKVYRNFTIQSGFGSVEVYEMSKVKKHFNLSREKLIAMSLLCGCDYDETGVHGIGPETSIKYLSNFRGDILKRLKYIKTDEELEKYEVEKNSCKKCHHPGKQQDHTKSGCHFCQTQARCIRSQSSFSYDNLTDEEKAKVDFELKLRKEVKANPTFPDEATINEYLNFSQEIPKINFKWSKPNILGFLIFMEKKCNWSVSYGFEKIIPVYCRWALINSSFNDFSPSKILKKRVLKAVPSFDVQWTRKIDLNLYFDTEENVTNVDLFTTVEPQTLVIEKCKKLYDEFMAEIENKKLAKKKPSRKKAAVKSVVNDVDVNDLIESVGRLSLRDSNCQTTVKSREKSKELQSFNLDKENIRVDVHCSPKKAIESISLEESIEERDCSIGFDLDDSNTVDYDISQYEIDESLILSAIIERRQYY